MVPGGVFNEARRMLKHLCPEQSCYGSNRKDLKGNTSESLNGPNNLISIYQEDALLGTWDGRNSNDDLVSNGVYHIKMDSIDAYGVVTTVTQQAMVSLSLSRVSVNIYNEAEGPVKHRYAAEDHSSPRGTTDAVLNPA